MKILTLMVSVAMVLALSDCTTAPAPTYSVGVSAEPDLQYVQAALYIDDIDFL